MLSICYLFYLRNKKQDGAELGTREKISYAKFNHFLHFMFLKNIFFCKETNDKYPFPEPDP